MTTTESKITLARMTTDHLAQILKIEKDVFRDPWSAAAFVEVLSLSPHNWVALDDRQVVGYLITQWVLDEVHILNVAVARSAQRRGVGRRLMGFITKLARDRGMGDMFLEVRAGNTAAIALYESFGFERISIRKKYYKDGEDALVMHYAVPVESAGGAETEQSNVDTQR